VILLHDLDRHGVFQPAYPTVLMSAVRCGECGEVLGYTRQERKGEEEQKRKGKEKKRIYS
jgi:hypothetical protein